MITKHLHRHHQSTSPIPNNRHAAIPIITHHSSLLIITHHRLAALPKSPYLSAHCTCDFHRPVVGSMTMRVFSPCACKHTDKSEEKNKDKSEETNKARGRKRTRKSQDKCEGNGRTSGGRQCATSGGKKEEAFTCKCGRGPAASWYVGVTVSNNWYWSCKVRCPYLPQCRHPTRGLWTLLRRGGHGHGKPSSLGVHLGLQGHLQWSQPANVDGVAVGVSG